MRPSVVVPPVDYPINDREFDGSTTVEQPPLSAITYATLLERHAAAQPITDEMILRARGNLDAAQRIPGSRTPDTGFALLRLFTGR